MQFRRLAPTSLYFGVTLAFAMAAHVLVELFGARDGVVALVNPVHGALALASLAAFAAASFSLGLGRSRGSERRRRLALFAAALPRRGHAPQFVAAAVVAQTSIAAGTLAAEGVVLDPSRIVVAAACGLLAVAFGAWLTRSMPARIIRLAAIFASTVRPALPTRDRDAAGARRASTPRRRHYALFVPNRPPPRLSAIPVSF
ncbi:MAG: hypothetical protein ABR591_09980 [Candidatus Velthaea sp.]